MRWRGTARSRLWGQGTRRPWIPRAIRGRNESKDYGLQTTGAFLPDPPTPGPRAGLPAGQSELAPQDRERCRVWVAEGWVWFWSAWLEFVLRVLPPPPRGVLKTLGHLLRPFSPGLVQLGLAPEERQPGGRPLRSSQPALPEGVRVWADSWDRRKQGRCLGFEAVGW